MIVFSVFLIYNFYGDHFFSAVFPALGFLEFKFVFGLLLECRFSSARVSTNQQLSIKLCNVSRVLPRTNRLNQFKSTCSTLFFQIPFQPCFYLKYSIDGLYIVLERNDSDCLHTVPSLGCVSEIQPRYFRVPRMTLVISHIVCSGMFPHPSRLISLNHFQIKCNVYRPKYSNVLMFLT